LIRKKEEFSPITKGELKMKTQFIKGSVIKKFFREYKKQIASDVLETVDRGVYLILKNAIETTKQFKRVTNKEVMYGNKTLYKID
jgi:hypothetical protein